MPCMFVCMASWQPYHTTDAGADEEPDAQPARDAGARAVERTRPACGGGLHAGWEAHWVRVHAAGPRPHAHMLT